MILHPDDLHERARLLEAVLAGQPASAELRFKHRDGHDIHALAGASLTHGADGERLVLLQAVDISERKMLEARLQHLADHDALTGLYSRRRFEEELAREVIRARRHRRPGALLLLDLDSFKQVNDRFGHATGDAVLVRVSAAVRDVLRASDVLARMGGDEFALLLPDTDIAASRIVAEKLVNAVRAHGNVASDGRHVEVTASVGHHDGARRARPRRRAAADRGRHGDVRGEGRRQGRHRRVRARRRRVGRRLTPAPLAPFALRVGALAELELERLGQADRAADALGVLPHALQRAANPAARLQLGDLIAAHLASHASACASTAASSRPVCMRPSAVTADGQPSQLTGRV